MLTTIPFLWLTITMGAVWAQTWAGTYIPSSSCNKSACCCMNGLLMVTRPSSNSLLITSGLNGMCAGKLIFSVLTTYPSGYTTNVSFSGQKFTCTLSSDSQNISVVSASNSKCIMAASKKNFVPPAWTGTYVLDSKCNASICCCMSGSVVLNRSSTNSLSITSGLRGMCGNLTILSGSIDYPSNYTANVTLYGQSLISVLSSDGQNVTIVNNRYPNCSGNAYKNNTAPPTWEGIYLSDSMCNTSVCCCINGLVFLAKLASNKLVVASSVMGKCRSLTYLLLRSDYPSGYSGNITLNGQTLMCTLSSDNQIINMLNPFNPTCNGNANKIIGAL